MEATAQTPTTTAADLESQGFTPAQIARLLILRADYPLIEMVDSRQALEQIRFLKWRFATGRLSV